MVSLLSLALIAAAPLCGNPYGPKCSVQLSTGVRMSYIDAGARDGEPVVLLHGYTDSSLEWARVISALVRLNPTLRLIALDQRGAGGGTTDMPDDPACRSHPGRCMRIADRVADTVAFMTALRLRNVVLVGHSMGSVVARDTALAASTSIRRLVLVSTPDARQPGDSGASGIAGLDIPPGANGPIALNAMKAMAVRRGLNWPQDAFDLKLVELDPDAFAHLVEAWNVSAVADPAVLRDLAARTTMVRLKYFGIDEAPVPVAAEHLADLSVPTLVLWGVQDTIMTREMQVRLLDTLNEAASRHPRAQFTWKQYGAVPMDAGGSQSDIGHEIVPEAPEQLAADLDSYIKTGQPTSDRYRSAGGQNLRRIIADTGEAKIVRTGGHL